MSITMNSETTPKPMRKVRRLTRLEKSQQIHAALMSAAAKTVGQQGYADTMVSTITARAKVAQGTFYNYFDSKQDLLDQLLPALGKEMLSFIKDKTKDATSALQKEEQSFRAFFQFLKLRPEFYRILYEAELFAPTAFQNHITTIASGYVSFLREARDKGELNVKNEKDLEPVAYMLMGIRHYLCMKYGRDKNNVVALPDWIVETYMSMVTAGAFTPKKK
ncbi:MAG: TetR/AcrR family transcriptional regulator [Burkholderiaceae bacterium]|nr:TetR/AcrR family transcriptional regulator [Burkholderiaceae bacterium]